MKKLLCVLLCLALLVAVAACGNKNGEKKTQIAEKKSDEEQIEELLVCQVKSSMGIATKEELRSLHTEAYWESKKGTLLDFDRRAQNGGATMIVTVDGESMTTEEVKQWLKGIYGENYVITAEVKEMESVDYTEIEDDKFEYFFPHLQKADIEEACAVTYVVSTKGDKMEQEQEEKTISVLKMDGKWYLQ